MEAREALGRRIEYTQVPIDTYIDALQVQGVPGDMQWLLRELFTVVFDGRNSKVMPGVEQALGRLMSRCKPGNVFGELAQRVLALLQHFRQKLLPRETRATIVPLQPLDKTVGEKRGVSTRSWPSVR